MKGTDRFKETIKCYLDERAKTDELFRNAYERVNRPIEDVITYILNYVQKSGCNGFSDDEIFGLAVHAATEDNIEIGKPINCKVVINHQVELTEEEKAEQKALALKRFQEEELRKLEERNKPKAKPENKIDQPSLFDF